MNESGAIPGSYVDLGSRDIIDCKTVSVEP